MSALRQSQGDSREERGIAEFKQKWPSMQGKYEALTAYVWKLSNEMLARDKILGYANPRPGGAKNLQSAVRTLEKKVVEKKKRFPRLSDVIEELDDLAGVIIATTCPTDWQRVATWVGANFVAKKVRKDWNGDNSVYKQHQPVFQNYTAQHFRVCLGQRHILAKPELQGLVIEIQLKTEDTASFNRIQHDRMYKPTVPLSEAAEKRQDAMVGIANVSQLLKSIELEKLKKQTLPFTDQGAWRVLKVLTRHGMKLSHLQFLPPLWIALQLNSLDNPQDLEAFCQEHTTEKEEYAKRDGKIFLPLFGRGSWFISVALSYRDRCHRSTVETNRVVGQHRRYRAWILANTFVGLHVLGMHRVIWNFLEACGYESSERRKRCSSLLDFLVIRGSRAPQESISNIDKMWKNLNSARSSSHFRMVMELAEMGVYPRLCSTGSYDSNSPSKDYMKEWVENKFCQVFWPAELGAPPSAKTKVVSEPGQLSQDTLSDVAYVARPLAEREDSAKRSGRQTIPEQQKLEWAKLHWTDLSEHWDWTTLAGSSLEENQAALRNFCQMG